MVRIRLFKTGTKHKLSYRIVVSDSRKKRNGANIEIIGSYDPKTKPPVLIIKKERLKYWISKGAQMSTSVKKIIENEKTS